MRRLGLRPTLGTCSHSLCWGRCAVIKGHFPLPCVSYTLSTLSIVLWKAIVFIVHHGKQLHSLAVPKTLIESREIDELPTKHLTFSENRVFDSTEPHYCR